MCDTQLLDFLPFFSAGTDIILPLSNLHDNQSRIYCTIGRDNKEAMNQNN